MRSITPCLWFDGKAEEAVRFYQSIFPENAVVDTIPGSKGSTLGLTFRLLGREFMALNGGPQYSFTPAISFFVPCETQTEIDDLWVKLSEGGTEQRCGWLTDKFGVSWQIVPTLLGDMLRDNDRPRAKRVFDAMLTMVKLDIETLRNAYEQP